MVEHKSRGRIRHAGARDEKRSGKGVRPPADRRTSSNQASAELPEQLTDLVAVVRAEVDRVLGRRLDTLLGRLAAHGVAPTAAALSDFVMRGGKRFRAALVMVGYAGTDAGAPREPAVAAGAAFELLHAYLLVQDDWMDGDAVRRGGPTVHSALGPRYGSDSIGAASAILASDFAWGLALELLGGVDVASSCVLRAMRELLAAHEDVVLGQQLDVLACAGKHLHDVERMHELKTASYTVRGPLLVGACLAGAPAGALRALARFASPLGVAFQLRDDLLGVFSDEQHTGKPFASDLRAGKRTAVTVLAERFAGESGSEVYARVLGNPAATRAELRMAADWLGRSGVRAQVEDRLRELCVEAIRRTVRLPLAPRARGWLRAAASELLAPLPPLGDGAWARSVAGAEGQAP